MTFEHRTYNTAPIATVASAVRAFVVKINNTSARRWWALEGGIDIAMGLSSGYIGSPQLLTGCRPVLLIRA